jgi:pimeloyl-ACP methyl ester carboxylesterase
MSASDPFPRDFTVRLSDGRSIGIVSVGRDDGFPIIHAHGSDMSRLEVKLFAAQADTAGVRLIGLDRPGVGRSDPKPGSRLFDWPDDVLEVADRLSIEQFAVEGLSAGGPYALACASKIPQRLTACGLISTFPPPDLIRRAGTGSMRTMGWIGAHAPRLLLLFARLVQRMIGSDAASIEKFLVRSAAHLGAADQQLVSNPEARGLLVQAMAESFRQGEEGNLEVVLALSRWRSSGCSCGMENRIGSCRLLQLVCSRNSCPIARPPSIRTKGISRRWLTMPRRSSACFVGSPHLCKRSPKMTRWRKGTDENRSLPLSRQMIRRATPMAGDDAA